MAFLGNLIWLLFGGWLLGLIYLIGAIILFPLFPFLVPLISYSFWPFGRKPVSKKAIAAYKAENNLPIDKDSFGDASKFVKFLGVTVWALTFGWVLAITHIISGIVNLLCCVFIITIPLALPNALGNFKLIPVAFSPFTTRLIPISLANDIEKSLAKSKL